MKKSLQKKSVSKFTAISNAKLKKIPYLFAVILFLLCPLPAFALAGEDISGLIIIYFTIIFFIFFLINIKYFKIATKNKKLFLIAVIPLVLFPLFYFSSSRRSVLLVISSMLFYLFLYYLLIAVYGIYYFKKIDKSIGFIVLKFCISAIAMLVAVFVLITIASVPVMF